MPDLYTAGIYNGEEITLNEFLLSCAKTCSPLRHQREEPISSPLRLREEGAFYTENLRRAEANLERFQNMTLEEATKEVEEQYNYVLGVSERRKAEKEQLKKRYLKMLRQVEAWEPPTPAHEEIKQSGIESLKSSIAFDCKDSLFPIEKEDPQDYITFGLQQAKDEIAYYKDSAEREKKSVAEDNKWILELMKSLEE